MIVPWSPPTTPVPAMKEDDVTPERMMGAVDLAKFLGIKVP